MTEKAIIICDEADPLRCKSGTKFGQCRNLGTGPLGLCPIHASGHAKFEDRQRVKTYNLTKWRSRLNELVDDVGIKSLREEIGILRILLETVCNLCHNDSETLRHSSQIADLIGKVEHVVLSCNRLEKSTGMMLDKSSALQIAGNIVSIISEHITDETIIEKIADDIIEKVLNIEYSDE